MTKWGASFECQCSHFKAASRHLLPRRGSRHWDAPPFTPAAPLQGHPPRGSWIDPVRPFALNPLNPRWQLCWRPDPLPPGVFRGESSAPAHPPCLVTQAPKVHPYEPAISHVLLPSLSCPARVSQEHPRAWGLPRSRPGLENVGHPRFQPVLCSCGNEAPGILSTQAVPTPLRVGAIPSAPHALSFEASAGDWLRKRPGTQFWPMRY